MDAKMIGKLNLKKKRWLYWMNMFVSMESKSNIINIENLTCFFLHFAFPER